MRFVVSWSCKIFVFDDFDVYVNVKILYESGNED